MNQQSDNAFNSWLPFYTLLRKEIRRFLRVASQTLVTPVITASLYLFIFGATLGERISVLEGFSYAQFVIPGLILMGIINNSFSNVASSLFMSRYLGSIVDLLVTPVSPTQFIMAYTLAAMLRGLAVGLVVWLISCLFATLPWAHPFAAITMACLASFLFAQFGIIAAGNELKAMFSHLSAYLGSPVIFRVTIPIDVSPVIGIGSGKVIFSGQSKGPPL